MLYFSLRLIPLNFVVNSSFFSIEKHLLPSLMFGWIEDISGSVGKLEIKIVLKWAQPQIRRVWHFKGEQSKYASKWNICKKIYQCDAIAPKNCNIFPKHLDLWIIINMGWLMTNPVWYQSTYNVCTRNFSL